MLLHSNDLMQSHRHWLTHGYDGKGREALYFKERDHYSGLVSKPTEFNKKWSGCCCIWDHWDEDYCIDSIPTCSLMDEVILEIFSGHLVKPAYAYCSNTKKKKPLPFSISSSFLPLLACIYLNNAWDLVLGALPLSVCLFKINRFMYSPIVSRFGQKSLQNVNVILITFQCLKVLIIYLFFTMFTTKLCC